MKFTRPTLAVALAGAAVWLTCSAFVQDNAGAVPDMAAAMKRWQEAGTPGPAHKLLDRFLGTWDTEMTGGFAEGGKPMKGTAEWHWLYEGRWIQGTWSGSFMGKPVQGQMTIGYDNFRKKYVTAGVDSFETNMVTSEGNADQSGNALITYGTMDEPMTGEVGKMVKYVWRFDGADKFTLEVHDLAIGETNTKVVEIAHARHK